jgi:cystathionine beta-lyase
MAKPPVDLAALRLETRLVLAGRGLSSSGAVNPPVERASTVVIPTVEGLYGEDKRTYGLEGMAVHDALRDALAMIEGAAACELAPSGLAACTLALIASTAAGGEVLVTDSVYGPTRRFCDGTLARYGVRARYYDPLIGAAIADLITPDTQAIVLESPGSLTFEMQDAPAIAAAARARGVATIIDNTWSAGVYFKPFDHGIDLSIQAVTKYQAGHADVLLGAVLTGSDAWAHRVKRAAKELGIGVGGADEVYLALRGLRTLALRLAHQEAAGLKIARALAARAEVAQVLHPALPEAPGHALWRRDFTGAAGVFGVVLKPCTAARVAAFLENLTLFSLGFSWGGFESLAIPCDPQITRTAQPWRGEGPLIRLSIGLEHPDDLIADLEAGLLRLGT